MNKSNQPVALITGASSGLGKELAHLYSAGGFHTILNGRDPRRLTELQWSLKPGMWSTVVAGNLHEARTIDRLLETVGFMGLNHLVLCAASHTKKPWEQLTNEDFNNQIKDFASTLKLMDAMRPHWSPSGGMIIHINSSAGKRYAEHEAAYAAVKHGVAGFLESVRPELVKRNIRVLDVFVGGMKTRMSEGRPDWENLMEPAEIAQLIFQYVAISSKLKTAQLDELHISRFR